MPADLRISDSKKSQHALGTPAGLRATVDAGAHAVYCGFRDETNARNFPGLNFDRTEMREGIGYAHDAHNVDPMMSGIAPPAHLLPSQQSA